MKYILYNTLNIYRVLFIPLSGYYGPYQVIYGVVRLFMVLIDKIDRYL